MNVTFQDISNKRAELDAIMQEYGEAAVKTFLQDFFNAHSYVTEISWNQYTPYFNDGEPCEFHTGEIYVGLTEEGAEKYVEETNRHNDRYYDYGVGEESTVLVGNYSLFDSDFRKDFIDLCDIIGNNQDTMRIALGDHVQVTAKPNEIIVEEYEHE